jgi:AcrR family transcriptional regulator
MYCNYSLQEGTMKVSKDKKDEIKKKLIQAAVEVMTEKGFNSATMREISSKAGLGSATIYHYFPNKEKILYAYFEEKQKEVPVLLKDIPDFSNFSLKEKLQIQIETLLDIYLQDREFVQEAYKMMFDSPLRTFTEFTPIKDEFIKTADAFFEDAVKKNEIKEHTFKKFISNLYWDYAGVVTLYWCNDSSKGFTNTSQLIDMSLDIIVEILKSGIIGKLADIGVFLFRNHIYSNFQSVSKLFPIKEVMDNIKEHANRKYNFTNKSNEQTKKRTKRKN